MSRGRERTDANPPLFSNETQPLKRACANGSCLKALLDRPPITPSSIENQSATVSGNAKSNSIIGYLILYAVLSARLPIRRTLSTIQRPALANTNGFALTVRGEQTPGDATDGQHRAIECQTNADVLR